MTDLAGETLDLADIRAAATRHEYLGDCSDLAGGSMPLLEPGRQCRLPFLALPGVVLVPTGALPLKLVRRTERAVIERALSAPTPFTRLIAVTCVQRNEAGSTMCLIGCIAEVKKVKWQSDGTCHALTRGRQRVAFCPASNDYDMLSIDVMPLDDADALPVPREAARGAAHWQPFVWFASDAFALACEARRLCSAKLKQVEDFRGSPLQLSWWLAANLPIEDAMRQEMLGTETVAARLTLELAALRSLTTLRCDTCSTEVASVADVFAMSEEGPAGNFVNTHGYVHDMVTLRRAVHVDAVGKPEVENSWFKGYAWRIAYCEICGDHLGWLFSSLRSGMQPEAFYGIRRSAIQIQQPGLENA